MLVMDYKGPVRYDIGGVKLKISFTDPTVGLICQSYFYLSQIEDAGVYEIVFTGVDKKLLDSDLSPENLIPEGTGKEGTLRVTLKEGFHLFFLPKRKKVFSFYPEGIFYESERQGGSCNLFYENTFNDEILPPNSSGVISTIYWFLECLGMFRLHAAYVQYNGMDIIFAGKGAVGKTTYALNVAMNGGSIYCDDQVFFRNGKQDRIEVYPSVKKIAITEKTIDFFPGLLSFKDPVHKRLHKYHFSLEEISPTSRIRAGVPGFVIFPFILNEADLRPPKAERMSSYEGFLAFLKGEILYPLISSKNRGTQMNLLERLSRQARIFSLYHCCDMERNFKLFKDTVLLERISENLIS
jgi:hypothetical protein